MQEGDVVIVAKPQANGVENRFARMTRIYEVSADSD